MDVLDKTTISVLLRHCMHVLDNTLANVFTNTLQLYVLLNIFRRVKFKQLFQHPKSVFQNTSFLTVQCGLPGCTNRKKTEGGTVHDYCCLDHAQKDAPNRDGNEYQSWLTIVLLYFFISKDSYKHAGSSKVSPEIFRSQSCLNERK